MVENHNSEEIRQCKVAVILLNSLMRRVYMVISAVRLKIWHPALHLKENAYDGWKVEMPLFRA